MQRPPGSSRRPQWPALPAELLSKIFQRLGLYDKIAAQSCCRDWGQVLKHPQVPDLWGDIEIALDTLPLVLMEELDLGDGTYSHRCLPTSQWIWHRSARDGISTLKLVTEQCSICDEGADCCEEHACRHKPRIETLLAVLLAPLLQRPIKLHVELLCSQPAWPVLRSPMIQQLLANNLVTLHLEAESNASINHCTRSTCNPWRSCRTFAS
ncbi:hypothetical protein WJX73_007896 [Symbiochloris irregularis]|uniref:F-box domain-containing protein n=1 Tax=Symbiochloris irregularis TaxID=706552 RepID=A0AAW1PC87_9CHLO